ncbi:MAG: hypothetical protein NVSMB52_10480 [Chloroflexota bacterium]
MWGIHRVTDRYNRAGCRIDVCSVRTDIRTTAWNTPGLTK